MRLCGLYFLRFTLSFSYCVLLLSLILAAYDEQHLLIVLSHLEEWLFHVGTQTYAKSMEVGNRNRATEYVKGDGLDLVILAF